MPEKPLGESKGSFIAPTNALPPPPPPTQTVELNATEIVKLDKIVNIDELKPNSVLAFSFSTPTPQVIQIIRAFGQRYGKDLQAKNISVILIGPEDKVESLDEAKMGELGWVRKEEKSRLILP